VFIAYFPALTHGVLRSKNKEQMMYPDFHFERKAVKAGSRFVIGVDEVGRGCFAGPLVVAAVVFPSTIYNSKGPLSYLCTDKLFTVNDSKKLTAEQRETLSREIKKQALAWDVSEVGVGVINRIGIGKANMKGMRRTIKDIVRKILLIQRLGGAINGDFRLQIQEGKDRKSSIVIRFKGGEKQHNSGIFGSEVNPKSSSIKHANKMRNFFVLVDYFSIPYLPKFGMKMQIGIKKGDQRSCSIAAASIIAKVHRDELMKRLAKNPGYKKYGWQENIGYGTKKHREAIYKYGLTKYHRKQFWESYLKRKPVEKPVKG
jgi:ribonuclease HII